MNRRKRPLEINYSLIYCKGSCPWAKLGLRLAKLEIRESKAKLNLKFLESKINIIIFLEPRVEPEAKPGFRRDLTNCSLL